MNAITAWTYDPDAWVFDAAAREWTVRIGQESWLVIPGGPGSRPPYDAEHIPAAVAILRCPPLKPCPPDCKGCHHGWLPLKCGCPRCSYLDIHHGTDLDGTLVRAGQ